MIQIIISGFNIFVAASACFFVFFVYITLNESQQIFKVAPVATERDTSANFLLVQIDDSFSCTNYIKIYNSGRSGIEYDQILVCYAK
jgi:hypothetical protein